MNLHNLYASCWTCWLGLNWNWNIATLWRSNSGSLQEELLKSSLAFHHFVFSTAQLWLNLLISFKSNSLLFSIYQLSPILFYSLNTFFSLYPIPPSKPSTLYFVLLSFLFISISGFPLFLSLVLLLFFSVLPPPAVCGGHGGGRLWVGPQHVRF